MVKKGDKNKMVGVISFVLGFGLGVFLGILTMAVVAINNVNEKYNKEGN